MALVQNQGKVVSVGELNRLYLAWAQFRREAIRYDPLVGRAKSIKVQVHPCLGVGKKLTNIRVQDHTRFMGLSFHVTFIQAGGNIVCFSVH